MKQKLHLMLKGAMFFKALVVMLFAFAFATTGYAQTSGTWGGIDWTLDTEGTLTIAPTKGEPAADKNTTKWKWEGGQWREAVIYKSNGGASAIGGWPYDRTKVKKLIIEEGVTSIGSFAAQGLTNLTGEVVIPWTVTYIGQEAFQKSTMTKLTFQKVPEGKTGGALCIAQGAFKNLIVEEIVFPNDRPNVELHAWLMLNSTKLKRVTLPANVTYRGTDHVDYNHNPAAQTAGYASSSTILDKTNTSLQTITFGSEEAKTLYSKKEGNLISSLTTFIGLTGYKTANVTEYTIEDGIYANYPNSNDVTLEKLTYKRTLLPAGRWNALYVPFNIPVSALVNDYDVAEFNNVHVYDSNGDGVNEMDMEVVLIKHGTLHAHHPYFIRAKSKAAENMNLELSNTKLFRTVPKITNEEVGESTEGEGGATEGESTEGESTEGEITISSAYLDFTLTGTYETLSLYDKENGAKYDEENGKNYAISTKGVWNRTTGIKPFRLYLNIKANNGEAVKIDEQKVRMRVAGEEATSIDEMEMSINIEQPTAVYDLQGRRVLNTEGLKGIYIVNGKKVAF